MLKEETEKSDTENKDLQYFKNKKVRLFRVKEFVAEKKSNKIKAINHLLHLTVKNSYRL